VTDAALQRQIEELQRQLADRDRQIVELRAAVAALLEPNHASLRRTETSQGA
jgi:hypothetical protein